MKNFLAIMVALLFVWNCFLSYEISTNTKEEAQMIVVENTVNGYVTDITETVDKLESKVVVITALSEEKETLNRGSGIVYESGNDGVYIVTNNHVVRNASGIEVLFDNGVVLEAELVGDDANYDVALLLVHPEFSVSPIVKGNSSIVKKGEYAIAMGSVINDKDKTVTFGVISGVNMTLSVDSNYDGIPDYEMIMIQTDAAINAGNSGGPLVNLNGELIGMNTMSVSSINAQGLNFAISSNELESIVTHIKEYGSVKRPFFGVSGKNIIDMEVYQKSYLGIDLELNYGVLVEDVVVGSPAYNAGIRKDDIIIKIGNTNVDDIEVLRKATYQYESGDSMMITYLRNQENVTTYVNFND